MKHYCMYKNKFALFSFIALLFTSILGYSEEGSLTHESKPQQQNQASEKEIDYKECCLEYQKCCLEYQKCCLEYQKCCLEYRNDCLECRSSCPRYHFGHMQSFFLYSQINLGDRPCFKRDINSLGLMYFHDCLRYLNILAFVDLCGSFFNDDNNNGFSTGIGMRFKLPSTNVLMGVNTYFDYQNLSDSTFRRASIGLEWLTCDLSFRTNVYFPISKTSGKGHIVFDDYVGDYIVEVDYWKEALTVFDFELRKQFFLSCDFKISPALGCYFLCGGCCNKKGVKSSLAIEWRDLASIEGVIYYDKCNELKAEAIIRIQLPFELLFSSCYNSYCDDWKKARVRRSSYIPYEKICKYTTNY